MIEQIRNSCKKIFLPFRTRYLKKRYNILESKIKIDKPSFVFCTYSSKIDPLILSAATKTNLHFVASKNYEFPAFDYLKKMFGVVCANALEPDAVAMRKIDKIVRDGGSVAFFPFENAFSHGEIKNIYAKIVKKYRIAVYIVGVFGSDFVLPFWAKQKNNTSIDIKVLDYFDKSFVDVSSVKKICARMSSSLNACTSCSNEFRCTGKCPAENVEKLIFACPECGALCTIKSKKDKFWCGACGEYATFLQDGSILSSHFKTLEEWKNWQSQFADEIIERRRANDEVILHDIGFKLLDIGAKKHKKLSGFFETFLFPDRLLVANKKFRKEIKLEDILDVCVDAKNALYIYAKSAKIKLLPTICISCFKYVEFVGKLKKRC